MDKRNKTMFFACDPTSQDVICYHQSICIGAVSVLRKDNEGVVPFGLQMANNADLIFTQALYIEL